MQDRRSRGSQGSLCRRLSSIGESALSEPHRHMRESANEPDASPEAPGLPPTAGIRHRLGSDHDVHRLRQHIPQNGSAEPTASGEKPSGARAVRHEPVTTPRVRLVGRRRLIAGWTRQPASQDSIESMSACSTLIRLEGLGRGASRWWDGDNAEQRSPQRRLFRGGLRALRPVVPLRVRASSAASRVNHHQPTRSLLQVLVGHSYATPAILADRQSASSCGTNQRLRSPVN
jgi:hypothetical protein